MDVVLENTLSDWQSVSALTGFGVGDAMSIQNKGVSWCIICLSDTKPDTSSTEGAILTSLYQNYASCTIDLGDSECWVRPVHYGSRVTLHVQEG